MKYLVITISGFILAALFFVGVYQPRHQPVAGQIQTLRGIVGKKPSQDGETIRLVVAGKTVYGKAKEAIAVGDTVIIKGELSAAGNIVKASVEKTTPRTHEDVISRVLQLKQSLLPIPSTYLPEREAALVSGMVLGEKAGDQQFLAALRKTGTIHILVVSGANLSMVAGFLLGFKSVLGRNKTLLMAIGVVWFYALFTGFEPPVIRAAIMITVTFLAQLVGRQAWDLYALFLAASAMLFLDTELVTDISFQLSFSATLGIILFAKPLQSVIKFWLDKAHINKVPFSMDENLGATLAAQLLVDPLILYHFNQLSLISPLVNILVLPIVFYVTVMGSLLLVLGLLSPLLGQFIALFILLPASYFTWVTTFFAKIPYASLYIPNVSLGFTIAYYFVLAVWFIGYRHKFSFTTSSEPTMFALKY